MDVTWDSRSRWLKPLESSLPCLDFFMPSINEAVEITGRKTPEKIGRFFLDRGVKTVVLKMGEQGCYVCSESGGYYVKGFHVPCVVDTTGAGDAFVAGFLAGLIKGWELRDCAEFANALGALCVGVHGTTAGIESFDNMFAVYEKMKRR